MSRFNSPELLLTWARCRRFPAIHDNMAAAALSYVRGTRILDLGCSFGLLGARIAKDMGGVTAIGVEADAGVISAAEAAGVPMVFHNIKITAETLPQLETVIRCHGIDIIIARRIMPELFGSDPEMGRRFAAMAAAAGVGEMLSRAGCSRSGRQMRWRRSVLRSRCCPAAIGRFGVSRRSAICRRSRRGAK